MADSEAKVAPRPPATQIEPNRYTGDWDSVQQIVTHLNHTIQVEIWTHENIGSLYTWLETKQLAFPKHELVSRYCNITTVLTLYKQPYDIIQMQHNSNNTVYVSFSLFHFNTKTK